MAGVGWWWRRRAREPGIRPNSPEIGEHFGWDSYQNSRGTRTKFDRNSIIIQRGMEGPGMPTVWSWPDRYGCSMEWESDALLRKDSIFCFIRVDFVNGKRNRVPYVNLSYCRSCLSSFVHLWLFTVPYVFLFFVLSCLCLVISRFAMFRISFFCNV